MRCGMALCMDVFNTPNFDLCHATVIKAPLAQQRHRFLVGHEDQVITITQSHREQAVFGARQWPARRGRSVEGGQGGRRLELLDPAEKSPSRFAETSPCRIFMTKGPLKLLVPEPDLYMAPRRAQYIHRYPMGYDSKP